MWKNQLFARKTTPAQLTFGIQRTKNIFRITYRTCLFVRCIPKVSLVGVVERAETLFSRISAESLFSCISAEVYFPALVQKILSVRKIETNLKFYRTNAEKSSFCTQNDTFRYTANKKYRLYQVLHSLLR